ncbi:MAG: DMT family transporter [Actinobacteria bacterium]|nr:DMT family transporter [Actinomycetota bacterium]
MKARSSSDPSLVKPSAAAGGGIGTLAVYLLLALTWGSSFLLMKIGLEGFAPAYVAFGRLLIGALTLWLLMVLSGRRWPRDPRFWGHLAVVAVLLCAVPFQLFAWAGQYLPSGLSAVLNATTPIWTAVFVAVFTASDRLTPAKILGVLVGAVGVAVVMGVWRVFGDPAFLSSLPAQLACLGATACYGLSFVWMKRFVVGQHSYDAVTVASVQVVLAAAISAAMMPLLGGGLLRPTVGSVISLLLLGALGTGIAYVWNTRVLMTWGPLAASSVTYLTPLVGVVLGMLVLGEQPGWYMLVGTVIVIVGVMLVQGVLRLPAARGRVNG